MKKAVCIVLCCILLMSIVSAADASSLQYSTYSYTPSNYYTTNCYGYSIGKNVAVDPGYYSSTTYSDATSFKNCIISDLSSLGYSVRTASSANATLKSNEVMIVYYYGMWCTKNIGNNTSGEYKGYHFWKKESSGSSWYHKFGLQSGIMKFNYTPTSSNRSYVSDEYYNGITSTYNPASFFAQSSGSWGYIIFNYYSSVSPNSSMVNTASTIRETSGELDHSIAAILEGARYERNS